MGEVWVLIGVCTILCFAAFGFFYLCMHRKGIDYTNHFLWTAGYFLSVAVVTAIIFQQYLAVVVQDFTPMPFVMLGLFIFAQVLLHVFFPRFVRKPKEYFARYPDRYYLKIDLRRLVSKSMDIMAQQVFIVVLVLLLYEAGLSFYKLLVVFGILFALLHVPLIASERGAWPSWLFAGIVVLFSVIFPTLILTVPYGFIYTYMIHWSFYMSIAVIFWIAYAERMKKTVRP